MQFGGIQLRLSCKKIESIINHLLTFLQSNVGESTDFFVRLDFLYLRPIIIYIVKYNLKKQILGEMTTN